MISTRDWEATFVAWSKPSSSAEQEKQENAERMIRAAIRESAALRSKNIEVFAQGSYKNNTNVRFDSDVDICVRLTDQFFYNLPTGMTESNAGISPGSYSYENFKNDVGSALVSKFGRLGVARENKAFDVHENSYRVDADVVACFEHRRYAQTSRYISGTEFRPDNGGRVINWPQQQYENGVAKNNRTGGRFKLITRDIKRLRNEMNDKGIPQAKLIPAFLIECLVWNAPDEAFGHKGLTEDVRYVLAFTFNNTRTDEGCAGWGEVSELKYLLRGGQPWTRQEAHAFLSAAWDYVAFKD
jgi:hypothetical protein